jgi:hypothetical protein
MTQLFSSPKLQPWRGLAAQRGTLQERAPVIGPGQGMAQEGSGGAGSTLSRVPDQSCSPEQRHQEAALRRCRRLGGGVRGGEGCRRCWAWRRPKLRLGPAGTVASAQLRTTAAVFGLAAWSSSASGKCSQRASLRTAATGRWRLGEVLPEGGVR